MLETMPQKSFGRGIGTAQDEWADTLDVADKIGKGTTAIRGWQPGIARKKKLRLATAVTVSPASWGRIVKQVRMTVRSLVKHYSTILIIFV